MWASQTHEVFYREVKSDITIKASTLYVPNFSTTHLNSAQPLKLTSLCTLSSNRCPYLPFCSLLTLCYPMILRQH